MMINAAGILDGTLGARRSEWLLARDVLTLALSIFIGTALGYAIANERWIIAGAVLASLLTLRWPVETAFGAFLFLVPFDSISVLGGKQEGTPLTWFAGSAAAIVLLATAAVQRRWQRPPRAVLWWSLMMLWAAATYLWAVEPNRAAERLPTAFSLLLLLIAGVTLRITRREFACVTLFAVGGGVAAGFISVLGFFSGTALGMRASLIMNDSPTDPNEFAASLLLPLALAVGWLLSTRRWSVWFVMFGGVALIAFSLFLTMSRGAMVALGLMFLILLFEMRVRVRLILPLGALILTLAFMPEEFFHRFRMAAESGGAGRIDIWTVGLAALKRYGLLGGGINNFPVAYSEFAGRASHYRGLARDPHNIYLGVWVELGIVGLCLMLLAVKSHMSDFRRLRSELCGVLPAQMIAVEAACWGMLGASFFLSTLWRKTFWVIWMLAAMAVALEQNCRSAPLHDDCAADTRDAAPVGTVRKWGFRNSLQT